MSFQTWLLISWQLCYQPHRSHVRKSLLVNMDFNMNFFTSDEVLCQHCNQLWYIVWGWCCIYHISQHVMVIASMIDVLCVLFLQVSLPKCMGCGEYILLVLCRGIHQSLVHFPHKWPVVQNFGNFFIVSLKLSEKSQIAGNLRSPSHFKFDGNLFALVQI